MSRLVDRTGPARLGGSGLAAFETVQVHSAYHARYLRVDGRRAYEVGNGCGTCSFWFTRLEGANRNISVDEIRSQLATGLQSLTDPAVEQFSRVLAEGRYLVMLLDVLPRSVEPTDPASYFWQEQISLWGMDGFWGLPHYTHVPYYRLDDTVVTPDAKLFEFIVPMYPARWLDADTITGYVSRLHAADSPTAVAMSVLDIKQPAEWPNGTQINTHWCLAHYLLDGHHKVCAAASEGRPVRLLSFLAVDEGVSTEADIERMATLLGPTGT